VKEMHIFKKIEKIVKLGVDNRKMLWYYMGVLHRANRPNGRYLIEKRLFCMLSIIVLSVVLFVAGALVGAMVYTVVAEELKNKRYNKRLAQVNAEYWAEWEEELIESTPEEYRDVLWYTTPNG
jgi:hypothetical protein